MCTAAYYNESAEANKMLAVIRGHFYSIPINSGVVYLCSYCGSYKIKQNEQCDKCGALKTDVIPAAANGRRK